MKIHKENYSQSFPTDMSSVLQFSVSLQTPVFMEEGRSAGLCVFYK